MKQSINKKIMAVALTTGLVLSGGGVAFAYFTADGSGTGSGTVGDSTAFTIAGDTPSGSVTPGGSTQTLAFTVSNPGSGHQYAGNVYASVATDSSNGFVESTPGNTESDVSGCLASWFSIDGTATGNGTVAVNHDIAPSDHYDKTSGLTLVLSNSSGSQDLCQGATVGIVYTTTPPV